MSGVLAGLIGSLKSAPVATSYDSIATTNGTGSSSEISFTSIPSDYTHLQIRFMARSTFSDSGVDVMCQVNSDTGSNYSFHRLTGDSSTVLATGASSQTRIGRIGQIPAATQASNIMGVAVIDLLDYKNTNKYKTFRSLYGFDSNTGVDAYSNNIGITSGLWMSTSAVTSIKLYLTQGNFTSTSNFALYGIKGA
jgi:short subunit dehydrogenase-like uncharacterized protein